MLSAHDGSCRVGTAAYFEKHVFSVAKPSRDQVGQEWERKRKACTFTLHQERNRISARARKEAGVIDSTTFHLLPSAPTMYFCVKRTKFAERLRSEGAGRRISSARSGNCS